MSRLVKTKQLENTRAKLLSLLAGASELFDPACIWALPSMTREALQVVQKDGVTVPHAQLDVVSQTAEEFYIMCKVTGSAGSEKSTAVLLELSKTLFNHLQATMERLKALIALGKGLDEGKGFAEDFRRNYEECRKRYEKAGGRFLSLLEDVGGKGNFSFRSSLPFSDISPVIPQRPCQFAGVLPKGRPFSALVSLTEIFRDATTEVRIHDGYLDPRSLLPLHGLSEVIAIKILTYDRANGLDHQAFIEAAGKFRKEHPEIEVRTVSDIHDRFIILDQTRLFLIGPSLKDAGEGKSGIFLEAPPNVIGDVIELFEDAWKRATPVSLDRRSASRNTKLRPTSDESSRILKRQFIFRKLEPDRWCEALRLSGPGVFLANGKIRRKATDNKPAEYKLYTNLDLFLLALAGLDGGKDWIDTSGQPSIKLWTPDAKTQGIVEQVTVMFRWRNPDTFERLEVEVEIGEEMPHEHRERLMKQLKAKIRRLPHIEK